MTTLAPETITITHTGTYGKLRLTGILTATPAQLKAGAAALARIGLAMQCSACGDKHTSNHNTKPGDPCLMEDGRGERTCASGVYLAVDV